MSRLPELAAKIDAFFARVTSAHGEAMQCATGCADCCHVRLTVTAVEATAIRALVAGWDEARRRRLGEVVAAASPERCAALDRDDRCSIYEARPVVCRSHGVPIRIGVEGKASLPVIQACHRNFAAGFSSISADCVLDQTTLSAMTLAVDRAAGGDGSRQDLAALLADLADVGGT